MKRIYMIGIVIVLVLLAGAYIISPFSPMNKVSLNGETLELPQGYTVKNSSNNSVVISNGSNTIKVVSVTYTKDLDTAISMYKDKYGDDYNITEKKIKTNGGTEVIKDEATLKNETAIRYWFVHKNKPYYVRTDNAQKGTGEIILNIIDSL